MEGRGAGGSPRRLRRATLSDIITSRWSLQKDRLPPAEIFSTRPPAGVHVEGGAPRSLTDTFDENVYGADWTADGIYFSASQKTAAHLFRLDPVSLKIARVSGPDEAMVSGFTFSRDGKRLAFTAISSTALGEVCVSEFPFKPRALTRMTQQAEPFILGTREVIFWKSKDGTPIDGVLIKPADFDPAKKYALLCVIHGGPTGVDRPALLAPDSRYYPADIWAGRGVPVEMVVYKGFGHGITKPKAMRAVMQHNLAWFGHCIFGDPKPDLSALPLPEKAGDKAADAAKKEK